MLLVLIASHIWKLSHYNETKQQDTTEVYVMDLWMKELVHHGGMHHLQQEVSLHMDCPFPGFRFISYPILPIPVRVLRRQGLRRLHQPKNEGATQLLPHQGRHPRPVSLCGRLHGGSEASLPADVQIREVGPLRAHWLRGKGAFKICFSIREHQRLRQLRKYLSIL